MNSRLMGRLSAAMGQMRLMGRTCGLRLALAVLALAALVALVVPGKAQQIVTPGPGQQGAAYFAVGSQAWGGTNSWVVVPGVGSKSAILRTLEVSTDNAPGRVVVFTNGYEVTSANPILSGTNIQVTSGSSQGGTNGFAAMDAIIIEGWSGTDKISMLAQVHSVGTTNISTRQSITNLAAGARIFRVGTNQVFTAVTNGATSLRSGGIITVGQKGQPMAIHILGTSSCFINAASGTYE